MSTASPFHESRLLATPIRELGLAIVGTELEAILARFQRELDDAGIRRLRPDFHLSTEWGVPFGTISIGIPFYLARPELVAVHAERAGLVEGSSPEDVARYLRHEMGHVVSYGYKLYEREDWVERFGSMTQPYVEEYRPEPFSRRFVWHLPGWYAQKHPDEDWAETFAVWLTPGAGWRASYADWPEALAKLEYCDRVMAELRDREPLVTLRERDEDVSELTASLEEYYGGAQDERAAPLPPGLDGALRTIFEDEAGARAPQRRAAAELILALERELVAEVYRWTGHFPEQTRPLVRRLASRARELGHTYRADRERAVAVAITALVTSLAMNHVYRGSHVP